MTLLTVRLSDTTDFELVEFREVCIGEDHTTTHWVGAFTLANTLFQSRLALIGSRNLKPGHPESTRNMRQLSTNLLFPGLALSLTLIPLWPKGDLLTTLLRPASPAVQALNLGFKPINSDIPPIAPYFSPRSLRRLHPLACYFTYSSP
jgi:hypothetical protein